MCFDRFITILLQKSLKLSAMILGSLVLALQMLATEYFGFWDQYHACWCPGSLSRQGISRHGIDSIGYATCGVAPLLIWSSVEQNLTYDTKCKNTFLSSQNNSELILSSLTIDFMLYTLFFIQQMISFIVHKFSWCKFYFKIKIQKHIFIVLVEFISIFDLS